MITLIGVLLTTPGGPWWLAIHRLAKSGHAASRLPVIAVLAAAGAAAAALGAAEIAARLSPRALIMFQGVALLTAGIAMLRRQRASWRITQRLSRSVLGGVLVIAVIMVADSALFLIMATAARTASPALAAAGGTAALVLVAAAARVPDDADRNARLLRCLRPLAGAFIAAFGGFIILFAMRLIG